MEGMENMTILISLIAAIAFSWFGAKAIKRHAVSFYIGALVMAAVIVYCGWTGVKFPSWFQTWFWQPFSKGAFATALFIVVMYMATLPNGSAAIKRLMPIRAELSIIASILTLAHNTSFGKYYFVKLFTDPASLSAPRLLAAICSVIMICILLPLFITSFKRVRRRMNAKRWKKLQRWAYLFYALIYIHIMLLNVSAHQSGRSGYILNIIVYSLIFFGYAALRVRKALIKRNPAAAKLVPCLCAGACVLTCVLSLYPWQRETAVGKFSPASDPLIRTVCAPVNGGKTI